MSKEIAVQDCLDLRDKFDKYSQTAEQHEFAMLAVINIRMDATIAKIKAAGKVENQKDVRAMFRVVLRTIGQDFSAYTDEEANNG